MSDIRAYRQAALDTPASGLAGVIASPTGELFTMGWQHRLALAGAVYTANIGTAATPVSFAKTAYDADQPQFVLDVPDGYVAVPLRAHLALQDSAGTDNILAVLHSSVNVGAGTSTAVTPVNNRTGGGAANCSVYTLYTGNGTDPTTGTEMWYEHDVYAFADATTDPFKTVKVDFANAPLFIRGTGSLVFYVVGATTAPAGYLSVSWAELPETIFTV